MSKTLTLEAQIDIIFTHFEKAHKNVVFKTRLMAIKTFDKTQGTYIDMMLFKALLHLIFLKYFLLASLDLIEPPTSCCFDSCANTLLRYLLQ